MKVVEEVKVVRSENEEKGGDYLRERDGRNERREVEGEVEEEWSKLNGEKVEAARTVSRVK